MTIVTQRTLMAALSAVALTALVVPAFAYDRHARDHHDRHPPVHYAPRGYYAPPPVVYAAPPQPAPGINLMLNFR
jgi:hypothetical protein